MNYLVKIYGFYTNAFYAEIRRKIHLSKWFKGVIYEA